MLSKSLKWLESLGGVRLPHYKDTVHTETVTMPVPKTVRIGMAQHRGSGPCEPIINIGDTVKVGQVIATSVARFSAPIHSSVSGTVVAIEGQPAEVVIEADGMQTLTSDLEPPVIKTRTDFIQAVKNSGLVGLGGAGFPTHVKLDVEVGAIDRLVINAAECEPFITSDTREMFENTEDIIRGIMAVSEHLQVEKAVVGIENGHQEAVKVLKEAIAKYGDASKIEVKVLPVIYPQGAEKGLVRATTGRVISSGKLPSSVGCVVMNVTSVAQIHRYLTTGIPLTTRRITVDGSAVATPQNVFVPLGTTVKDVFEFCGGFKQEAAKIIQGGPMMGQSIPHMDLTVTKFTNALLAFGEEDAHKDEATDCIRCSRCVSVCPMSLMPVLFEQNQTHGNVAALNKLSVLDCVECGSCSYICPSNRPLVESIRLGKTMVRSEQK